MWPNIEQRGRRHKLNVFKIGEKLVLIADKRIDMRNCIVLDFFWFKIAIKFDKFKNLLQKESVLETDLKLHTLNSFLIVFKYVNEIEVKNKRT